MELVNELKALFDEVIGSSNGCEDFFEAGGTSLTAMRLLKTVNKRYKAGVKASAFLSNPTAEHLASLIVSSQEYSGIGNGDENDMILNVFNSPYDIDNISTVTELFEKQVQLHKDKTAVYCGGKSLSYDELDKKANVLANCLRSKGVSAGSRVAVISPKCLEAIIGILAIVKAGAAYVPIDMSYPKERINIVIEDCAPSAVLTYGEMSDVECGNKTDISSFDFENGNISAPEAGTVPDDIIYCIYTSGTTGTPKGVLIRQKSVVNLVIDNNYSELDENTVILQAGQLAFDASTFEIWGSLLNGGTLFLADTSILLSTDKLKEYIRSNGINTMFVTSALFSQIIREDVTVFDTMSHLMVGGETVSEKYMKKLHEHYPSLDLRNAYGPTETTTFATSFPVKAGYEKTPIGKPLRNVHIYIMNDGKLCKTGEEGEICIAGAGVAAGYLNKPELTDKAFEKDPFAEGMMYHTGDIGKWLADGNIEYIGRLDGQIKIRGFRIEPGDIENAVERLPEIEDCVVKLIENHGKKLCAYYTSNAEISETSVREKLAEMLPPYMIPSLFMHIEKFEMSANGKIDRNALPEMKLCNNSSEYLSGDTEEVLCGIFSKILCIENYTPESSFFDLGGNSLAAMQILYEINRHFGVKISFGKFWNEPDVRKLKEIIENSETVDIENDFVSNEDDVYFDLTDLQQSYFIGRQSGIELGGVPTHLYAEFECSSYDHRRFVDTINFLISRHDVMRCVFTDDGRQKVEKSVVLDDIPFDDISAVEDKEGYIDDFRKKINSMVLDIKKPPLMYFHTLKVKDDRYIIAMYLDGLTIDGWSFNIISKEIDSVYRGGKDAVEPLTVTFRQYVEYKKHQYSKEDMERAEAFWNKKIESLPDAPMLPFIKKPSEVDNPNDYGHEVRTISSELWEKLKKSAASERMSPFIISLTAYCKAIARYCANQEFLINIPVSTRLDTGLDLDNVLGDCSDFFIMSFKNIKDESFYDTAVRIRNEVYDLQDNMAVTGTEIVRRINNKLGHSGELLAPIVFTSIVDMKKPVTEHIHSKYVETHTNMIWIDSVLTFCDDDIHMSIDYVSALFDRSVICNIADIFIEMITEFADSSDSWKTQSAVKLSADDEKLIAEMNDTVTDIGDKSYGRYIREAIEKYSDRPAVYAEDRNYTYAEFFRMTSAVSDRLLEIEKNNNRRVAVILGKGFNEELAAIGTVLAGKVYAPLDYDFAPDTIIKCIEKLEPDAIITDDKWLCQLEGKTDAEIIDINSVNLDRAEDAPYTIVEIKNDDVFCIIHTSGSTGLPKGIELMQAGLINCFVWSRDVFEITENDCALAITNHCHDMSLYDIFGLFMYGAAVALIEHYHWREPEVWRDIVLKNNVTFWNSVPSFMEIMLQSCGESCFEAVRRLRCLMHGGEVFTVSEANKLHEINPECMLFNVGGPSETTIWNVYHRITEQDLTAEVIPYGRPIYNTEYYIMNECMEQVPVGVQGIICTSGIGTAKGYIGAPIKKQSFMTLDSGKRIYYTGDVGVRAANGEVIFKGRNDNQVKINGKRIELDGIANTAAHMDGVTAVKVILAENKTSILLYYTAENDVSEDTLTEYLKEHLADYMIPSEVIKVENMPKTSNGKIDSKALLKIRKKQTAVEKNILPVTDTEKKLVKICQECLDAENVYISDNIFLLGGNSLKAIKLLSMVRAEFNCNIGLSAIFNHPVLSELCTVIDNAAGKNNTVSVAKNSGEHKYPLTPMQKVMFLSELSGSSVGSLNISGYIDINGKVDTEALKKAIEATIMSCSSLRFCFAAENNEPYQFPGGKSVDIADVFSEVYADDSETVIRDEIRQPLSVMKGENYKFKLVHINGKPDSHTLVITMNHLVVDDMSYSIITKRLLDYYDFYMENSSKELKFNDDEELYGNYLISRSQEGENEKALSYWNNVFSSDDVFERFNSPMLDAGERSDVTARTTVVDLKADDIQKLQDICSESNATLYVGFISLISAVLASMSSSRFIPILSPVSDRLKYSSEDVVGMFVDELFLPAETDMGITFREFIEKMKNTFVSAYEAGTGAMAASLEKLHKKNKFYRNRLGYVLFDMLDAERDNISSRNLETSELRYYKSGDNTITRDIYFLLEYLNGKYEFSLMYKKSFINENGADKICEAFSRIVPELVEKPDTQLFEIILNNSDSSSESPESDDDDISF